MRGAATAGTFSSVRSVQLRGPGGVGWNGPDRWWIISIGPKQIPDRGYLMRVADRSTWKIYIFCTFLIVALLTAIPNGIATEVDAEPPAFKPDSNAPRSAIPETFKWDLSPLFASDEAWDAARLELLKDIPGLEAYDGRLAEPAALRACLELYFRLHSDSNFVTLYANLRQATAQSDETANSMVQRSLAAMDELMQTAAFVRREVLTLSAENLEKAYAAEPGLDEYRSYLDNLRRRADRLLSPEAERVLAVSYTHLRAHETT